MQKVCPTCAAVYKPQAVFCDLDGARLEERRSRSRFRYLLWLVGLFVVALALGIFALPVYLASYMQKQLSCAAGIPSNDAGVWTVSLDIRNDSPFQGDVDSLTFQIDFSGQPVGSARFAGSAAAIHLPAHQTATVPLVLEVTRDFRADPLDLTHPTLKLRASGEARAFGITRAFDRDVELRAAAEAFFGKPAEPPPVKDPDPPPAPAQTPAPSRKKRPPAAAKSEDNSNGPDIDRLSPLPKKDK